MMDDLGNNIFYIDVSKKKLKNDYLKNFMISIYSPDEINEFTSGG